MSTAFAALVASSLEAGHFTLVDLGCSGGIDPAWRVFGDRLRALAIDASVEECKRLAAGESHQAIHYQAGFLGLPRDHPSAPRFAGKPYVTFNPYPRSSSSRTLELRHDKLQAASEEEKLSVNAWHMTELSDSSRPIGVMDRLAALAWDDVDFVKIDIDGADFQVLTSLDRAFEALNVLAARLEVNLFGGTDETEHTFHNTDRFMRHRGFELLALEPRSYSMAALPSPYAITMPAQTVTGRAFQAEAFYARDLAGAERRSHADALPVDKLAKLAAIYSIWNQPDGAAEILLLFRERFESSFNVDLGLDMLAAQTQVDKAEKLDYRQYLRLFEADPPDFYPPDYGATPSRPPRLLDRMRAAWRAFSDPAALR